LSLSITSEEAEDVSLSISNNVMKMVSKSCSGRPTTRDYYNSVEIDLSESRLLKHMIQIGYIVGIYCHSDVVVGMEWRFGEIKRATGPIQRSTDDFIIVVMSGASCHPSTVLP